jgi:hypothetical protein
MAWDRYFEPIGRDRERAINQMVIAAAAGGIKVDDPEQLMPLKKPKPTRREQERIDRRSQQALHGNNRKSRR